VYVSTAETLQLPFYLTGRFNLKLRLLHEGVLVGAGPQIDPGFSGRLSCPLHNLSDKRVSLACGEPFAVLEFQKTTPFAEMNAWSGTEGIDDVRRAGESLTVEGIASLPCLTFPAKSLNREPVQRYVRTGLVKSSLQGLASKIAAVDEFVKARLKSFRTQLMTVNALAFVAVVGVGVTMGTYFVGVASWYRALNENAVQAIERVKQLEAQQAALVSQIQQLQREVQTLRSMRGEPLPATPGSGSLPHRLTPPPPAQP
jgi:hypothetical protein